MAGFIRRYGFAPGVETLTQIEGVIIIDLPPPGSITGVGVGTACIVGEFADCTFAAVVDTAGVVTTKAQPVQVFSAADMLAKVGGWDETLGDFGGAGGNGFAALRNKRFSALVITPVNLASAQAQRYFRKLPANASATSPLPVVPMQAGTVLASREFKSEIGRAHV